MSPYSDHLHLGSGFLLVFAAFRPRWRVGTVSIVGAGPGDPLFEPFDELRVCMV